MLKILVGLFLSSALFGQGQPPPNLPTGVEIMASYPPAVSFDYAQHFVIFDIEITGGTAIAVYQDGLYKLGTFALNNEDPREAEDAVIELNVSTDSESSGFGIHGSISPLAETASVEASYSGTFNISGNKFVEADAVDTVWFKSEILYDDGTTLHFLDTTGVETVDRPTATKVEIKDGHCDRNELGVPLRIDLWVHSSNDDSVARKLELQYEDATGWHTWYERDLGPLFEGEQAFMATNESGTPPPYLDEELKLANFRAKLRSATGGVVVTSAAEFDVSCLGPIAE